MMQGVPTVLPNGISNAPLTDDFAVQVPMLWPSQYYTWMQDFDYFLAAAGAANAADWLSTLIGTGTAVVIDATGGQLAITNSAAAGDTYSAQWQGNNNPNNVAGIWTATPGKQAWYSCRWKVDDGINAAALVGMAMGDTTPFDVTDGLIFTKPAAAAIIQMQYRKTGQPTQSVNIGSIGNNTYLETSFAYDGGNQIQAYVNGQRAGAPLTGSLPSVQAFAPTLAIQNGTAAARTLTLDWMLFCCER